MSVTPNEFRKIALSFAEASERAHMGHPDFRAGGKIFATLGYPDDRIGVVMLTPEEQEKFVGAYPKMFTPVTGAWGRRGSMRVNLDAADGKILREALTAAWQRRAGSQVRVRGEKAGRPKTR
jgi:hypothetical protein